MGFILIGPVSAATYYVDAANGNDGNTGLSEINAWKSVNKVNYFPLKAGDTVLFKRGQSWNEMLIPTVSGTSSARITFGAYGTGDNPVIGGKKPHSGWTTSSSWTQYSSNVWVCNNGATPGRLWLNGKEYGYASSASAVNSVNRWYFDGNLYVYSEGNPSSYYQNIESLYSNWCAMYLNNRDYLEFRDLSFEYGKQCLYISGSSNIIIHSCDIGYGATVGMFVKGNPSTLKECVDNEFYDLTIDSGYRLPNTYFYALDDGVHFDAGVYRNSIHDFTLVDWGHSALYLLCTTNAFPHGCSYNKVWNFYITAPSLTYGRGLNTDGLEGQTQFNEIFDGTVKDTWTRNQFNGDHNIFRNIVIDTVHNSPRKSFGIGEGIMFECYGGCVSHDNLVELCTIMNTDEPAICVSGDVVYNNIVRDNTMIDSGLDSWHAKDDIALYIRDWTTTGRNTYANNQFYQSNGNTNVIDFYGAVLDCEAFNSYDDYKGRGDVIDNNRFSSPSALSPIARIQAAPQTGDAPLSVQFTDASENGPTAWHWEFGDGTTSTEQNPAHTYENAGSYTVTLTATNADGADTATAAIEVTEPIQPPASEGVSVLFADFDEGGEGVAYHDTTPTNEEFCDYRTTAVDVGMRDWTPYPLVTAIVEGEWLRYTMDIPEAGTYEAHFSVYSPEPGRSITISVDGVEAGTAEIPEGPDWQTPTEAVCTVAFETAGQHQVTLQFNGGDFNAEYFELVPAGAIAPIAGYSSDIQTGDAPLTVQFTDVSENSPTEWYWEFGDGTTATEQNPLHTYEGAGTYTVSLTATNEGGSTTETKVDYITVHATTTPPVAGFITDVTAGDAPLAVQFTDASENSPTEWHWDFGDGTTATEQNPLHTYENAGSYTAILTVTNADGTDTATAAIAVTEPIQPPTSEGEVLFIAGDASLKKGDRSIHDHLEALGLAVTVVNDDACSAADAEGKDLVYVSSTIGSHKVGSIYRDLAVPFITHESYLFDDMKMTGTGLNTDYGSFSGESSVVIGEVSHPLTADLSGTVAVYTVDEAVSFGKPAESAVRVARDPADSTRCVLFGYDEGAEMVGMTAPARRVGLFLTDSSSSILTDDGWMLFDAAVAWALEETQHTPPIAQFSSNPQTGDAPLSVQFTDSSENSPTEWYWEFGDGTTATEQNPLHIYENAGSYTATLTATNADGADTATAAIEVTEPIQPPASEGALSVLFADFDEGGEGVAYHDTTPTNEEFCDYRTTAVDVGMRDWTPYPLVTATADGEWLRYTLDIPEAGAYEAHFYVYAPEPGRTITISVDGVVADTAEIPQGTDWQTPTEAVCTVAFETAGQHQVTLQFNGGDFNAEYFELVPSPGIPGDFNENGVIDMDDVTKASFMANDLIEDDLSGDLNHNGYIDDNDVAQMLYLYLKISNA